MRGVSAVIATILLLMITVALAATAYVWFSSIFSTVTTGGTSTTERGVTSVSTSYAIETSYYKGAPTNKLQVYIRNTGTTNINMNTSAVYINDVYITTDFIPSALVTPNSVGTFNVTNTSAVCGALLKVSFEMGTPQTRTISC